MKKIIAIITIGAATASLQLNAQETKTSEKETYPEAQEEVIGEREQPSADYQHNQYGTYPQGIDSTVVPQTRIEISQSDLPEEVISSFENSEYSGQEIVAVYEVKDEPETDSDMQKLSNESDQPISDPTPHNELNERSRIETNPSPETEMSNPAEESQEEVLSTTETETTLNEEDTDNQSNTIDPRPSDTEMYDSMSSENADVTYEIEVKDKEDNKTTLTYSEEGELKETSEESSM